MARDRNSARQHVLDTAIELIHENGAKKFRIEDVTKRANVAIPTIYYHFDSKERLIAEAQAATYLAIIEALSDCVVRAEAALDDIQRDDYLRAVGDKVAQIWAETQINGRWRMVELLRDVWKVPTTQRAFSEGVDAQVDRWTAIVERGQDLDWVSPDLDARSLVVFFWSASLGQMIFADSKYRDVAVEDIRRVVLHLIGAKDRIDGATTALKDGARAPCRS